MVLISSMDTENGGIKISLHVLQNTIFLLILINIYFYKKLNIFKNWSLYSNVPEINRFIYNKS